MESNGLTSMNKKYVKVGSSMGKVYLLELQKAKSCHYCTHFNPLGFHGFAATCKAKNDVNLFYGQYHSVGQKCDLFECKPELIYDGIVGDNYVLL